MLMIRNDTSLLQWASFSTYETSVSEKEGGHGDTNTVLFFFFFIKKKSRLAKQLVSALPLKTII